MALTVTTVACLPTKRPLKTLRAPSRGYCSSKMVLTRKQANQREKPPSKVVPFLSGDDTAVRTARTFYRRTGSLFLTPRVSSLWGRSPFDAEILSMLVPCIVALVLEPVQMSIETAVVGRLGVSELGAVGFGTVIFQFALGLFAAFVFATTPQVANAVGSGDKREASQCTARGMWVAALIGIVLQTVVSAAAPSVLGLLSSDAQVAQLASSYLRMRAFGIPAALVMMVAIGAARGHKNMAAPLVGSAAYGIVLAVLDVVLVLGMGLRVEGAGAAAAAAQWLGAAAIIAWLVKADEFDVRDLLEVPKPAAVLPYFRMTPSLAVGSMAALSPMLAATSFAASLGPECLAAHTVLRQITGFWLQAFLAFNVTAHSMVASSLGEAHRRAGMEKASSLLERICQLAVGVSLPLVIVLLIAGPALPRAFTSSTTVASDVHAVLPFLLCYMPLDAIGVTLEGGILGAADTKWVAMRGAASSALSLTALFIAAAAGEDLITVWLSLKVLNFSALGLDLVRFMGPVALQKSRDAKLTSSP